jgi:hypothetical protein
LENKKQESKCWRRGEEVGYMVVSLVDSQV